MTKVGGLIVPSVFQGGTAATLITANDSPTFAPIVDYGVPNPCTTVEESEELPSVAAATLDTSSTSSASQLFQERTPPGR